MKNNYKVLDEKKIELSLKSAGLFTKPGYLLATIILSIFFSEAIVMLILSYRPSSSLFKIALLDATVLSITVFPMLFFLMLKPMRNYLNQRIIIEKEKEELIEQLKNTIAEIKVLKGIIPICASCKNVRTDQGFWQQVEVYVRDHSEAKFSHGICPDCKEKIYPNL